MWYLANRAFLVKAPGQCSKYSELFSLSFWSWPCLMRCRGRYQHGQTARGGCPRRLDAVAKRADPDAPAAASSPLRRAAKTARTWLLAQQGEEPAPLSFPAREPKLPAWPRRREVYQGLSICSAGSWALRPDSAVAGNLQVSPGLVQGTLLPLHVRDVTTLCTLPAICQLLPLVQFGWGKNFCIATELHHRVQEFSSCMTFLVIF